MVSAQFAQFRDVIRRVDPASVTAPDTIPDEFLLVHARSLSVHYIPFDYVNRGARVVVVGITPGFVQWKNAVAAAHRLLVGGATDEEVLRGAKYTGAFSGAIRPNLVALLDAIGLQHWLGIASCATLFHDDAALMHVTAVLRHPVFVTGREGGAKNYNGASPDMVNNPVLQAQMLAYFAHEAAALPDALYVPLGPKVGLALDWLARRGVLDADRILHGLPHPSGANAERIAYFLGRKERAALSSRTDGARIDADRQALLARMAALGVR